MGGVACGGQGSPKSVRVPQAACGSSKVCAQSNKGPKRAQRLVSAIDLCALSPFPPRNPAALRDGGALCYNLTPRARPNDAVLPPPAPTG